MRLEVGVDEVGRLVRVVVPVPADGGVVLRADGHLLELLEAAGQGPQVLLVLDLLAALVGVDGIGRSSGRGRGRGGCCCRTSTTTTTTTSSTASGGRRRPGRVAGVLDEAGIGGDAPLGVAGGEQPPEDDASIADALLVGSRRVLGLGRARGLGVDGHGGDEGLPRLPKVLPGALLEDLGGLPADGPALPLEVEGADGTVAGRGASPGRLRVGPAVGEPGGGGGRSGRGGADRGSGGRLAPPMVGVVRGLLGQEGVRPALEHDGGPAERVGGPPHVVVGLLVEAALDQGEGVGLVDGRVDGEGGRQGRRAVEAGGGGAGAAACPVAVGGGGGAAAVDAAASAAAAVDAAARLAGLGLVGISGGSDRERIDRLLGKSPGGTDARTARRRGKGVLARHDLDLDLG